MKKISTIVIIFMLFTTLFPASFLAEPSIENVEEEEISVEESVILYTNEEADEIHVYEDELLESISHTIPNASEVDLLFIEKSETEEVSFIHFILEEDEVLETDEASQAMEGYIPNEYIYSLEEWEAKLIKAEESDMDQDLENDTDEEIHIEENTGENEEKEGQELPPKNDEVNIPKHNKEIVQQEEEQKEPVQFQRQSIAIQSIKNEKNISKLGHIRTSNVMISPKLGDTTSSFRAGSTYTNKVYYIKKQVEYNGDLYYLLSERASSTIGIIGWAKAVDIAVQDHVGIDKNKKLFFLKGTGSAYNTAWGGSKNLVYKNLTEFKQQVFQVHLTEKIGNNLWYRGTLNGKTVWIHSKEMNNKAEENTSLLAHIRSGSVKIYPKLDGGTSITAGSIYTNRVYYVKKQAIKNQKHYYLISQRASSTLGVIGWVEAKDLAVQKHVTVDNKRKIFAIAGTGNSYDTAWGGKKNYVYSNLATYKNKEFIVNLTEKVGNNTWYRGTIDGKTMWVHSNYVKPINETAISMLGHMRSRTSKIYNIPGDEKTAVVAGTKFTNTVYYVKKKVIVNGVVYYHVSTRANPDLGSVGWVKAKELAVATHKTVDKKQKTFYVVGQGKAFDTAWGGNKNAVYDSLTNYQHLKFTVNLTEKVGNNTWYRGDLEGRQVWLPSNNVTTAMESSTSKLGHIKSGNVEIYSTLGKKTSAKPAGAENTNRVYYIKKQVKISNQILYLISRNPSATTGVVGWVKAENLSVQDHVTVDKQPKVLYITDKGSAYSKAWGGSKDIVFKDLLQYENVLIRVNLTERIGNTIWYRGVLAGKTVWVHNNNTKQAVTKSTNYNITLNKALEIQKGRSPQTDKYRNNKAYIEKRYVTNSTKGTISGNGVNLRTSPSNANSNNIAITGIQNGTEIQFIKEVNGSVVSGSAIWYEIKYRDQIYYVHSTLANKGVYRTNIENVRVHETMNTNSHVYGTLGNSALLTIKSTNGNWYEISYSNMRNAKEADVKEYLDPNNNNIYQHLLLTESVGVPASELNKLLVGKGKLSGQGSAFVEGAKQSKINEVYLISHAILETGHGTSPLSKGVEVGVNKAGEVFRVTANNKNNLDNIKTVYNMFGIQAEDSCALDCGSVYAYKMGWDTPRKAIIGGAQFIGPRYIYNNLNQNTLYKMRWNPQMEGTGGWKQYATDIGWANKQAIMIEGYYKQLTNTNLIFDIAKFK